MKNYFPVLFLLLLATACGTSSKDKAVGGTEKSVRVKYAENFKVLDKDGYRELQILDPEKGKTEQTYALVKRGSKVQTPAGMIRVEVPLQSIIALSGTHIGMIDKINCAARITGISSHLYLHNSTVKRNFEEGKVLEYADFAQLNPERILRTPARVIVFSGFGQSPPNEDKLRKLDIQCIPNYDWRETHPLGKAEWIKFFGYLLGREAQAQIYFDKVEKSYLELKKSAAESYKTAEKPTVFSGSLVGDTWYMPAGESYGALLFRDANCAYTAAHEKGTGSVAYPLEKVLTVNQHTTFWFNPGFPSKQALLTFNPKYRFFGALNAGKCYCYSHDMNYFWENSAIEPQEVLADLIQILHGATPQRKLHFYRQLQE
jgi:iron complex transport system substrate-binding protein